MLYPDYTCTFEFENYVKAMLNVYMCIHVYMYVCKNIVYIHNILCIHGCMLCYMFSYVYFKYIILINMEI